jgi:hypothetical protein
MNISKERLKEMLSNLPDRGSPVWDSAAGLFPQVGGPVLGGARASRNNRGRSIARGAVGAVGGATIGSMAGKSMGDLAALVLAKIVSGRGMPAVQQMLRYSGTAGGLAGGAVGARLTTTGYKR